MTGEKRDIWQAVREKLHEPALVRPAGGAGLGGDGLAGSDGDVETGSGLGLQGSGVWGLGWNVWRAEGRSRATWVGVD